MILLVLGVVGVTYYAVVWTNYGPALSDRGLYSLAALFIIILFHFLVNPFIHLNSLLIQQKASFFEELVSDSLLGFK